MGNVAESRQRAELLRIAPGNGVSKAAVNELLHRKDYRCTYCGTQSFDMGVDHAIPLIRGGAHDINNLVPCCRRCNSRKGDRTPEEYAAFLVSVKQGTPRPRPAHRSVAAVTVAETPARASAPDGAQRHITVEKAAAIIGCDASQVRRLFRAGKLPGERVGKRTIILDTMAVCAYAVTENGGWPRGRPRKRPEGDTDGA